MNQLHWRTRLLMVPLLVAAFAMLCVGTDAVAQESVQAGKEYLSRFPWYEEESNSLIDLDREEPGEAATLNRADQPLYTPKAATPAAAPMNFGAGWLFSSFVWILIAVGFGAIIIVLLWVFLQMESKDGSSAGSDLDEQERMQERIQQLPFQVANSMKGDFRDMAAQAAQRGEYGSAVMLLFSHILLLLDKKSLIELKRGKTNRQYLRELKSHQSLVDYYQQVMVPFEDNFFGDHKIAKNDFEKCWHELDRFQSDVEARAATAIATT